jgi:homoserine O-acetyltransferase
MQNSTINIKKIVLVITALVIISCNKTIFKSQWTNEIAPENFVTRFETSKGTFDIQINREGSPKAVDRFYQLVKHHYYDNTIFYRVVPNFVVQFGIIDTTKTVPWKKYKIPDEKVIASNQKGTISFARDGKDSRDNHLFINLKNNQRLDTINYNGVKGFPAFGNVIKGMEVVDAIYSGYGDKTMSKLDSLNRSQFLEIFPKLDLINKVYILKTK